MSIDFVRPEVDELRPRISVIGVGGAGGNAIANMMRADVQGVDFIVANTDAQALNNSEADRRIQLGLKITQGLGAGSRPEIGRAAAEETIEDIIQSLEGAHMCFIAAGMGGFRGAVESMLATPSTAPLLTRERVSPLYFFSYTFIPLSSIAFHSSSTASTSCPSA